MRRHRRSTADDWRSRASGRALGRTLARRRLRPASRCVRDAGASDTVGVATIAIAPGCASSEWTAGARLERRRRRRPDPDRPSSRTPPSRRRVGQGRVDDGDGCRPGFDGPLRRPTRTTSPCGSRPGMTSAAPAMAGPTPTGPCADVRVTGSHDDRRRVEVGVRDAPVPAHRRARRRARSATARRYGRRVGPSVERALTGKYDLEVGLDPGVPSTGTHGERPDMASRDGRTRRRNLGSAPGPGAVRLPAGVVERRPPSGRCAPTGRTKRRCRDSVTAVEPAGARAAPSHYPESHPSRRRKTSR